MAEGDQRGRVVKALAPLHGVPVENRGACPGTPDVNYEGGWIETKWLRSWPKRTETIVPVDHFTPQQRIWLRKRRRVGGHAWVLLQCKREWILLDGEVAADILGRCTRQELFDRAHRVWLDGLNDKELVECLRRKS